VIAELLSLGLMEAGDYRDSMFHPWPISTGDAITRVTLEWLKEAPESIPEMWSIVWLRNTPIGDEIGLIIESRRQR
jgi:hypothetical protein